MAGSPTFEDGQVMTRRYARISIGLLAKLVEPKSATPGDYYEAASTMLHTTKVLRRNFESGDGGDSLAQALDDIGFPTLDVMTHVIDVSGIIEQGGTATNEGLAGEIVQRVEQMRDNAIRSN